MFRSLLVPVCLCLCLGASAASAAEPRSSHVNRETGGLARIVGQLEAFFKAFWENDAGDIDPWGKTSPKAGPPAASPASTDDAGCIDPFGGCSR
ncbi:MAG: hypothetical protein ABUT39_25890 [Acidobacteriota bacterium]